MAEGDKWGGKHRVARAFPARITRHVQMASAAAAFVQM